MKKIYTVMIALMVAVSVYGQRVQSDVLAQPRAATEHEDRVAVEMGRDNQVVTQRGADFFYEDFSNGFDGSTSYGAWTTEDTGTTPIWQVADAMSPGGEFSNPATQALASETAENGWVIFDCDLYNTPISSGVEDVTGFMYSPVIDMSTLGSAIVEYQQTFRYCCFPTSPLTLEVTVDGGDNWAVFPGHGTFVQAANEASANPLTTKLDISCVAAGASEVQLRWAYNSAGAAGYSHYFWGIDDVRVYENPFTDNLEVLQVVNGDIFNIWEYRNTPMEQVPSEANGGLLAGVVYRNTGSNDQADVVVTVEVLDAAEAVVSTTSSEPFSLAAYGNQGMCPPQLNDTIYMTTGFVPAATGIYTMRATMTSAAEGDDVPEDNTMDKTVEYTDDEYGHDDEDMLNLELAPRESDNSGPSLTLWDPTGYGNFYTFPNEGSTIYGLLTRFGSTSDEFVEFETRLYQGSADSPYDPNAAEIYGWNFFTLGQAWIDDSQSDWVYFPFEDAVEVEATADPIAGPLNVYFGSIINEFESEFQLTMQAQANSDTDNSSLQYEITGAGDFVWFTSQTATPAVRLIHSERVGLDELTATSEMTLGQNAPNPAVGITNVALTLMNPHNVTLEVRDASGRLVRHDYLGNKGAGQHNIEINTSDMAPGTYTYAVIAGMERLARQMIVAGK